jgi:cell wall-associated NlpC family hydrolase
LAQTTPIDSVLTLEQEHQLVASDSVISLAKTFIGVPYKYGGLTPESGFDCSGFVKYVYERFGLEMPRTSMEIADIGVEVPLDSCRQGDIIVFAGRDKIKRPIGHVGIITSAPTEPVSFIHSARSKNRGIVISAFEGYEYFQSRLVKVIRLADKLTY